MLLYLAHVNHTVSQRLRVVAVEGRIGFDLRLKRRDVRNRRRRVARRRGGAPRRLTPGVRVGRDVLRRDGRTGTVAADEVDKRSEQQEQQRRDAEEFQTASLLTRRDFPPREFRGRGRRG